jgi:hypothetical protein
MENAASTPSATSAADGFTTSQPPHTGFGFVEPAPPYDPGPRQKLPKHLRHLWPLRLVE